MKKAKGKRGALGGIIKQMGSGRVSPADVEQMFVTSARSGSVSHMRDIVYMHESDWIRHQFPLGVPARKAENQFAKMILPGSGWTTGVEYGSVYAEVPAPTKVRGQDKVKKTIAKAPVRHSVSVLSGRQVLRGRAAVTDVSALATTMGWSSGSGAPPVVPEVSDDDEASEDDSGDEEGEEEEQLNPDRCVDDEEGEEEEQQDPDECVVDGIDALLNDD